MNYLIQYLRRWLQPRPVWIVRQPGSRLYWCGVFYSPHFSAPKPMFAEDEAAVFLTRQAALAQWQEHHPDADAVEARYAPNIWRELDGVRLRERLYFPDTTFLKVETKELER